MPDSRSVKMQITKLLKKNGIRPSKPSKSRIKPSHGMRMMDAGFIYRVDPFDENSFYLGYYPGQFSMKLSDERVGAIVQSMYKMLSESEIPADFALDDKKIRVTVVS